MLKDELQDILEEVQDVVDDPNLDDQEKVEEIEEIVSGDEEEFLNEPD
jgi:hypothetical protein